MTTAAQQREFAREDFREWGLLFNAEMVRATLDGRKLVTRRPITTRNSYVDGSPCPQKWWDLLVWDDRVYVDRGPSPVGNAGPYLHVPRDYDTDGTRWDTVHRVYPRVQVGDVIWGREEYEVDGPRDQQKDVGIIYKVEDSNGDDYEYMTPPEDVFWKLYHQYHSGAQSKPRILGNHPSVHMPRWASRCDLPVVSVRPERVNEITEKDAKLEGVPVDLKERGHCCAIGAFEAIWRDTYGTWDENPWVWRYQWSPIR